MYGFGLYPCYPFKDQSLSMTPVKPPGSGGKWGDQKAPEFQAAAGSGQKNKGATAAAGADDKKNAVNDGESKKKGMPTTPTKSADSVAKKLTFNSPVPLKANVAGAAAAAVATAAAVGGGAAAAFAAADAKMAVAVLKAKSIAMNKVVLASDNKDFKDAGEYKQIDVPNNGTCLYYCFILSLLLPLRADKIKFSQACVQLFGAKLGQVKIEELRVLLLQYDATCHFIEKNELLTELIDGIKAKEKFSNQALGLFRQKVVGHLNTNLRLITINNHDEKQLGPVGKYLQRSVMPRTHGGPLEITAMADMFKVKIEVFQADVNGIRHDATFGKNFSPCVFLMRTNNHFMFLIKSDFANQLGKFPLSANSQALIARKSPVVSAPKPMAAAAATEALAPENGK